jgi:hypothetical protein
MSNHQVLPFPLARRRSLVARCAARMLSLSPAAAERHLEDLLRTQANAMRRRRIDETLVRAELRSLQSAVRAALWQRVFAPGGAA